MSPFAVAWIILDLAGVSALAASARRERTAVLVVAIAHAIAAAGLLLSWLYGPFWELLVYVSVVLGWIPTALRSRGPGAPALALLGTTLVLVGVAAWLSRAMIGFLIAEAGFALLVVAIWINAGWARFRGDGQAGSDTTAV